MDGISTDAATRDGTFASTSLTISMRLIVDGASLELFVNGGLASVYFPVQPTLAALRRASSGRVRLFTWETLSGGAAQVSAVAAAHVLSNHANAAASSATS